jgi:hypothetical protein
LHEKGRRKRKHLSLPVPGRGLKQTLPEWDWDCHNRINSLNKGVKLLGVISILLADYEVFAAIIKSEEQSTFGECLLPLSSETFVFTFPV